MPASPLLSVSVLPERSLARLVAQGEVDLSSAPGLEAQIAELWASGWQHVVMDLHGVTFMDSTGLRVLVKAHKEAATAGATFELAHCSEPVVRLLELTALNQVLAVRDESRVSG